MIGTSKYAGFLILSSLVILHGCQKPGPAELQPGNDVETIEVEPMAAVSSMFNEPDTTGLVRSDQLRYYAQIVTAGVRSDEPNRTETSSIVRVIFTNRLQPIYRGPQYVGCWALDIGTVLVDGLPLFRVPRRLRVPINGTTTIVDTVVGVEYVLRNNNGIGGRGFTYAPKHQYDWRNTGYTGISLATQTRSADEIRVLEPHTGWSVNRSNGLRVQWTGGEDTIYVVISTRGSGQNTIPFMRLKIRGDRKQIVIPPKILRLLPSEGTTQFLFSFISQTRSEATVTGYADPVLIHTASVHNILLTIQR